MKARKKGENLPVYSLVAVEVAMDRLPDPGDAETEYWTVDPKGVGIVFRRVPTVCPKAREQGCFWKWELMGRVEEARP